MHENELHVLYGQAWRAEFIASGTRAVPDSRKLSATLTSPRETKAEHRTKAASRASFRTNIRSLQKCAPRHFVAALAMLNMEARKAAVLSSAIKENIAPNSPQQSPKPTPAEQTDPRRFGLQTASENCMLDRSLFRLVAVIYSAVL